MGSVLYTKKPKRNQFCAVGYFPPDNPVAFAAIDCEWKLCRITGITNNPDLKDRPVTHFATEEKYKRNPCMASKAGCGERVTNHVVRFMSGRFYDDRLVAVSYTHLTLPTICSV